MAHATQAAHDAQRLNDVATLAVRDGIAVLTLDSPPVNALSAPVRDGLLKGVTAVTNDPALHGSVVACAGRTFIAGADITEFGRPPVAPSLQEVIDALEACPKPVVAAIHGTALGGGLEVALACHFRVAVAAARVGLPEIKLGLIPGAGGTQRLPRLIGAAASLSIITSGDHVPAPEAQRLGILDELVTGDLVTGAVAFARAAADGHRFLRRVRDLTSHVEADRANPGLFDEFARKNARQFRGRKAPALAIEAIRAAATKSFDEGMADERRYFLELVTSVESRAMRHVFFAEREAAKIPDVPADLEALPIAKIGVIGAGTMGGGIAMNFLNAGIPVRIVEREAAPLERGLGVIRKNYETTAQKGRMTLADIETRMGMLDGSVELDVLADCDLIIEAVFENMEIKKDVFGRLDRIAKPGAILATNTSYLNVDEIASATTRPESVLGLHFFSPANVMRLLEIVRGARTDKRVLATAMKLAKTINKVGVMVGVCHGFVGNRMLSFRQRQAHALVNEGAMPWDVDRVLYEFGFPMGPFAMSDLAGLDIGWDASKSKGETIRDVLCEMGRRGQKTGAGFYDYDENRTAKPSPVTEQIIRDFARKSGVNARDIGDDEILERTILPMINEGAKILDEGIASRASDIDIVWVTGYGWPAYRGGPMFHADVLGLPHIVARLEAYEKSHGAFFTPAPLLKRLAAEGGRFTRG